jgi:hypothetical protein
LGSTLLLIEKATHDPLYLWDISCHPSTGPPSPAKLCGERPAPPGPSSSSVKFLHHQCLSPQRRTAPQGSAPPLAAVDLSLTIFRFTASKYLRRSYKVSTTRSGPVPISLFFTGAVVVFTSLFFLFSLLRRSSRAGRSGESCF